MRKILSIFLAIATIASTMLCYGIDALAQDGKELVSSVAFTGFVPPEYGDAVAGYEDRITAMVPADDMYEITAVSSLYIIDVSGPVAYKDKDTFGEGDYRIRYKVAIKDDYFATYQLDEAITATVDGNPCETQDPYTSKKASYVYIDTPVFAVHNWDSDYTQDSAPTCTTDGAESIHCLGCDATRDARPIPHAGHIVATDSAKAATCTATGLTAGTHCDVCGTVLTPQQTTAKLGHSYAKKVVSPTYFATGYTRYTCTRCGYSYKTAKTAKRKLARPSSVSLTAKRKGFTVKYAKVSAATGYQICYAKDSKFTTGKKTLKVTKNTILSRTVTKLTAKKRYYVRVRAYKRAKVNGSYVTVYSSWTSPKSITTKK